MKLSDYQNEEALEVLADIIEPATMIIADKEVQKIYKSGQPKLKLVTYMLKHHSSEVLDIMAGLDGVPREEYKCNILTLPVKLLEIMNDEQLLGFFSSQASMGQTSSGNATESTEEVEEE